MVKYIILIPGANPETAKLLFSQIKENLKSKNYSFVQLDSADEQNLVKKAANVQHKIIIGKSLGGRIALDYQLEYKNAEALILLSPAAEAIDEFREIEIPILLIHGTKDLVISIENSRELKTYLRNSKLIEIENADHSYRGKEKETAEIVANWILSL
jgi:pimeloyl-ACP methyl ester carboxylesterase